MPPTLGLSPIVRGRCRCAVAGAAQAAADYASRDGRVAEDEYFFAEQNARLVANAEQYYRAMFARAASSHGTSATPT